MRVYNAKYDAAYNTADNSLTANLLKYPEIAKKIIELYPRYTTTYLLEKLSFGAGEKVLGDNSFEWKSMGRYRGQQQLAAELTTDSAVGVSISFSMTDTTALPCLINTSDIVRLASGLQVHVESIVDGTNVKTLSGKALNVITAAAAADTVKVGIHGDDTTGVSGDAVFIAEILSGEAFLLPRPAFGITWKLASGDNAVGVEVLILSA